MQITLKVENLSVKLTSVEPPRQVLNNICAHIKPGQILAVMGPSGSGKTTLLSALSGRIKSSGRILLNGTQVNKSLRRQICYVLQNDVFFTNLTLRQTLVYAAMLRLPDSMSHEHKMRQVDQVIEALDLESCQNTIIGDFMQRGLSGGEKKRCSIACELLSNPAVMVLDEPTSSLDSCTALSLIKLLKQYAMREGKTIILSIHQPSSQIFYLFDKLLLLSKGQMMYFGSIQQVLPYFRQFNYHMQHLSYNPADFLMDIMKSVDERELSRLSVEARECYFSLYKRHSLEHNMSLTSSGSNSPNGSGNNFCHAGTPNTNSTTLTNSSNAASNNATNGPVAAKTNVPMPHRFVSPNPDQPPSNHHHHSPATHHADHQHHSHLNQHSHTHHHQALQRNHATLQESPDNPSGGKHSVAQFHRQLHHPDSHHLSLNHHLQEDVNSSIHSSWSKIYIYDDRDDAYSSDGGESADLFSKDNKWPSGFFTQLYALISRNFIDGKARMLSKLNWIQALCMAFGGIAIWYQVPRSEDRLNDIKGWMYFSTMYWMMFALFNAITSFPAECQVVNKERSAGIYRLSAYYLAKMIGELPLVIALPSAFHLISYLQLGCHNFYTFMCLWGFAILNALAAQSVGMFIGFTFSRLDLCITIAAIFSTLSMLFAGFYSNSIAPRFRWLRYCSIVYYGYLNMQMTEFGTGPPIRCVPRNSKYPSCNVGLQNSPLLSTSNCSQPLATDLAAANRESPLAATNHDNGPTFISRHEILVGLDPIEPNSEPNPIWVNTLCLIGFLVMFRILGYIVLRVYHKPV